MSAREALLHQMVDSFIDEERANKLIDDLLHEAAEKQRAERDSQYGPLEFKAEKIAINRVVDLIDPRSK